MTPTPMGRKGSCRKIGRREGRMRRMRRGRMRMKRKEKRGKMRSSTWKTRRREEKHFDF